MLGDSNGCKSVCSLFISAKDKVESETPGTRRVTQLLED